MIFVNECPTDVEFEFSDVLNGNQRFESLIKRGTLIPRDKIVECLNLISERKIEDIDLEHMSYTSDGEEFGIWNLCLAERIFLLSAVAVYTNTKIFIIRLLQLLDLDVLDTYFKLFGDYDSIAIYDNSGFFKERCNRVNNTTEVSL